MKTISRIGCLLAGVVLSPLGDALLPFVAGLAAIKSVAAAVATLGGGPVAHPSLVVAIGLMLLIGCCVTTIGQRLKWRPSALATGAVAMIVAAFGMSGELSAFGQAVVGAASEVTLATSSAQFSLLLQASIVMLALPMIAVGIAVSSANGREKYAISPVRVAAFAFGLMTYGIMLSAAWGRGVATSVLVFSVTIALLVALYRFFVDRRSETQDSVRATSASGQQRSRSLQVLLESILACCVGIAFVALSRLSDQLVIATLWTGTAKWASLCIGFALGSFLVTRWSGMSRAASGVIATAACCWPLAFFGSLVGLILEWSTFIESPSAAVALRTGMLSAVFMPLGVVLGISCRSVVVLSVALVTGYVLASAVLLTTFGVSGVLLVAAIGMLAHSGVQLILQQRVDGLIPSESKSHAAWRLGPTALAVLCVASIPIASSHYRPDVAARLLFDTRVFVAHRVEQRADILQHLDEARCVAVTETGSGTLTQWRMGGPRVQLRQSGLLTATHSLDAERAPQVAGEALLATLPLVLHERPNHVAVLGLRSGLAVESALQFPVQSLTCIEADSELSHVVQRDLWPQLSVNPALDDRLSLVHAEPTLALAALPNRFDLIISNADQAVLLREAAAYTADSYQQAAKALAPGGLFCQRIAVADIGQETVSLVLDTWQQAFHEVAVIETSLGEWLLVGANSVPVDPDVLSEQPIVSAQALCLRRGLVERLQRPHVRRAFAAIGADWASPLLLNALVVTTSTSSDSVAQPTVNEAGNPLLTARLPFDVLRWGNKLDEINAVYGSQTQPLARHLGAEAEAEEVTRRLTELAIEKQIVAQHPDEFWAYRKVVKKRLTEAPYSTIIQVKGERPTKDLHPSEKRRLAYFETLGSAAKSGTPSMNQLVAVAAFAQPHDPLISPFLHEELAELAHKAPKDGSDDEGAQKRNLEWSHRMQTINFSTPNDRSVRNVVAAIELLVKHPELVPHDADRGDQLDALLQSLHARWFARGDITPQSSQVMLSDLEHSIAAIDLAFGQLDQLHEARSLSRSEWDARKVALEKSLVGPLRQYRQMLAAHQLKERKAEER